MTLWLYGYGYECGCGCWCGLGSVGAGWCLCEDALCTLQRLVLKGGDSMLHTQGAGGTVSGRSGLQQTRTGKPMQPEYDPRSERELLASAGALRLPGGTVQNGSTSREMQRGEDWIS